jgi:hypothetical protein
MSDENERFLDKSLVPSIAAAIQASHDYWVDPLIHRGRAISAKTSKVIAVISRKAEEEAFQELVRRIIEEGSVGGSKIS